MGESGHCYTGSDAKEMAKEQAAAIKASGYKGDKIADCYNVKDFMDAP